MSQMKRALEDEIEDIREELGDDCTVDRLLMELAAVRQQPAGNADLNAMRENILRLEREANDMPQYAVFAVRRFLNLRRVRRLLERDAIAAAGLVGQL